MDPNDPSEQPTEFSPPQRDMIGRTIGRFTIVREIKAGGMGVVYEAKEKGVGGDRRVALKTIRPERISKDVIERFEQEAGFLKALEHASICRVYEADVCDGIYYLVMEYAERGSLSDHVATQPDRRLSAPNALRWLRQAAEGLLVAEKNEPRPIYHRDIKPQNLLLNRFGDLLVADFGIAKLGRAGANTDARPCTPDWAAPEQKDGEDVDQRADIYSLGKTFYCLLTGSHPADVEKFERRKLPRGVRKSFRRVLEKMMAVSRESRYQSFAEVLQAVQRAERDDASMLLRAAAIVTVAIVAGLGGRALWGAGGINAGNVPPAKVSMDYDGVASDARQLRQHEDWEALQEIEQEAVALEERARAAATAVAEQAKRAPTSTLDGDQPLLDVVRLSVLRQQLTDLEKRRKQGLDCRAALRRLKGGLVTIAVSAAAPQLEAIEVGYFDALRTCVKLVEESRALRSAIDAQRASRRGKLTTLREQLERGDALVPLADQVSGYVAAMQELGEQELATEAQALSMAVARAIEHERNLPTWSASDSDPQRGLRELLRTVAGLRPPDPDEGLREWWRARQRQLGAQWSPDAVALLFRARTPLEERSAAAAEALKPGAGSPLTREDYDQLVAARADFDGLRRSMRTALRQRQAEAVFRGTDLSAKIEEADLPALAPWPERASPLTEKEVEDRRARYATLLQRAKALQLEARSDPSEVQPVHSSIAKLRNAIDEARAGFEQVAESPTLGALESIANPTDLQSQLDGLSALRAEALGVRDALGALENELDGISTKVANERLGTAVGDGRARQACPALAALERTLAGRIRSLAESRDRELAVLRAELGAASADLAELTRKVRRYGDAMKACGEDDLAGAAESLLADVELAERLESSLVAPRTAPAGEPLQQLGQRYSAIKLEAEAIDAVEAQIVRGAGERASWSEPLRNWWNAWTQQVSRRWANSVTEVARDADARIAAEQQAVDALVDSEPAAPATRERHEALLRDLGVRRQVGQSLLEFAMQRSAFLGGESLRFVKIANAGLDDPKPLPGPPPVAPVVRRPVPDALAGVWPPDYAYPDGIAHAKVGERFEFWFEGRKGVDDGPVPMLLIHEAGVPPFLVDRHEVTLAEMAHLRHIGVVQDYLKGTERGQHLARHWDRSRDTFAFWVLTVETARAVAACYEPRLDLPTPEQWRILTAGLGPAQTRQSVVGPKLSDRDYGAAGTSRHGVMGLNHGLAEWCRDGTARGEASWDPRREDGLPVLTKPQMTTGFRCVYDLVPNPR